jgi:hypothetical protein
MNMIIDISNYALVVEKKSLGYLAVNEAADMQNQQGLDKVLSGRNGGAYGNQWNKLMADYNSKKGVAGTYTFMVKHDNDKDMVNVTYQIGTDGKPVKGSIKLATETGGAANSTNAELKLSEAVTDKLKARINYVTKSTNVDESQVAYILEAVLYHATSHSFNENQQRALFTELFTKQNNAAIASAYFTNGTTAMEYISKALIYPGSMNFNLEDDDDCKNVISIVGATPKIASVEVSDKAKLKTLAQSIFNIVDDTIVTGDEEAIAAIGVLALNRASVYRLINIWNDIHKANAGGKGLGAFIAAELGDDDMINLFNALYRAITGTPSQTAKDLLAEPK